MATANDDDPFGQVNIADLLSNKKIALIIAMLVVVAAYAHGDISLSYVLDLLKNLGAQ